MAAVESFEVEVVSSRALSPSVRELTLVRVGGAPIAHKPGQWVNLMMSVDGANEKRAYSIASAPDGSGRFEIAVTRVEGGPVSEQLHALHAGARIRAVGPSGFFTRAADDPEAALFVATGTGLTPLRAMIQAALEVGSAAPLWILFGVRHEEDIIYRSELEDWAAANSNVRFEVTLSQPAGSWSGRRGYVQSHLPQMWSELRAACPGDAAPHVFVCGLDRMVKVVRDLARKDLGVERKHVHQERYD